LRVRPSVLCLLLLAPSAFATHLGGLDARLMRYPDVSQTQVAFSYAGDIWLASKDGGLATRLSTPPGEETFPRFSPDGTMVAFSGNYDGNTDVYVLPVTGGVPRRLTYHPMYDRVIDWTPDGKGVIFASGREAGRDRFDQLFVASLDGGLPRKLPVPFASFASLTPDGRTIAFTMRAREGATWKRYRGGETSEIWLLGIDDNVSERVSDGIVNDSFPMFAGGKLWFLSDRGEGLRPNFFVRDPGTKAVRQVTHLADFDVRFPAMGPGEIVFEHGGHLKLLDVATEQVRTLEIFVQTDRATLKPRTQNVSEHLSWVSLSPSGKRLAVVARGDVFSVPANEGVVRNLTGTSGSYERFATWSPDGKSIAYFTDASGEYELAIRPADGGEERTVTKLGPGFRYTPWWSPDSKSIAFCDQAMRIRIADVATGKITDVDRGLFMFEGELRGFRPSWSADSRWLAWSRGLDHGQSAIFLWDAKSGKTKQVTSGFSGEFSPVFDPDGKYLWLLTTRHFEPTYGSFDDTWVYADATQIACIPLRKDVASPIAPKNDVEDGKPAKADDDDDDSKKSAKAGAKHEDRSKPGRKKGDDDKKEDESKPKPPAPVAIDLDGFEERLVLMPQPAGNYADLHAISGKLVYRRIPHASPDDDEGEDDHDGPATPALFWNVEDREEKTIVADADFIDVASSGAKVLVVKDEAMHVVDVEPDQELEKAAPVSTLEATIDPVKEWRQIFDDAWRFERDYFYDPNMHGVDWNAMRTSYGELLTHAVTRWDVNVVLGEMIGELSSSHAYRGGGETEHAPSRNVGLPGCDFELTDGRYRIARILHGAPWDSETRSPLREPGVDVKEGDYLLAVNGTPVDTTVEPWAAFDGLAGDTVELTVGAKPSMEGSRKVVVKLLRSEERLRQLDWMEKNREHVDERSKGRIGYVYVQDTGVPGQTDLARMFYGEYGKPALLVDERFNSGGQIPDRFVELLNRPITNYWAVRDGRDWQWPPVAHAGPKAMLINGWSGSGGDAFPFFFREAGLGPLIGRRTWGGLIGLSGSPDLVDGGVVTVPTFSIYSMKGEWIIENHGVDPDIEVLEDPALMRDGGDPQLDKAIDVLLGQLEKAPYVPPKRPAYTRR
jgi:tricorn protease